ncbi:MAG: sigma-70 family RNA polymerase sigma factor [Gemmataceae bacterium]
MHKPDSEPNPRNIRDIETIWPLLQQAHAGGAAEINAAQQAVLQRYRPAVYRYLLACLGNPNDADEVCQEFAFRFVRGDFRRADPEKGRFRDLLKSALYHLIIDFHKKKQRQGMAQLSPDAPEPADSEPSTYDSDRQFLASWRADLLNKAWEALADEEQRTGRPMHTVLQFRASHPEQRSAEMARHLTTQLGKEISDDWVRKWLKLARDRFAENLLLEVRASLEKPTPDDVLQELVDLKLLEYCKDALETWRKRLDEEST